MNKKYCIKWSENIEPAFSDENDEHNEYGIAYSEFGVEQVYPIGNVVDSRRLFHAVMTKEQIDAVISYLTEIGKEPKIVSVACCKGCPYGYKAVTSYDEETGESSVTYEAIGSYIVTDEEGNETEVTITPYECEDDTDFFIPYEGTDEEGNVITITPPDHKFSGWC